MCVGVVSIVLLYVCTTSLISMEIHIIFWHLFYLIGNALVGWVVLSISGCVFVLTQDYKKKKTPHTHTHTTRLWKKEKQRKRICNLVSFCIDGKCLAGWVFFYVCTRQFIAQNTNAASYESTAIKNDKVKISRKR